MAEFGTSYVGIILGALAWLGRWIGGASVTVLRNLVDALHNTIKAVAKALADAIVEIAGFFARVWLVIWQTIRDVLIPLARALFAGLQWIQRQLARLFKPILEILADVRKFLQKIYDEWLRPILDLIDAARLFLRGLSLLGVDWADDLERLLARLERALSEPLLLAIRKINEIADLINRIVTLDGLFQRLYWLRSFGAYRRPMFNFLWNSHSTPLGDGGVAAAQRREVFRTEAQVEGDLLIYVRTRGGPLQPFIDEMHAQLRINMRR